MLEYSYAFWRLFGSGGARRCSASSDFMAEFWDSGDPLPRPRVCFWERNVNRRPAAQCCETAMVSVAIEIGTIRVRSYLDSSLKS